MKKSEQIKRQTFYVLVASLAMDEGWLSGKTPVTEQQSLALNSIRNVMQLTVLDVRSAHRKFDALVDLVKLILAVPRHPACVIEDGDTTTELKNVLPLGELWV